MIRGRNIIAIASNWHFDPTSKHHVMQRLAAHNNVLWVNYHGSRRPSASGRDLRSIAGKLGEVVRGVERMGPQLSVMTPLLLPLPGSGSARRVNRTLVVRQIRRALRQFPEAPTQLWSFAPDVSYLMGQFGEELDLYYCVDEFSAFSDYDTAAIQRLERELINQSDIVITTSEYLRSAKSDLHPYVHLVAHGVDYEHFSRSTAETTAIPKAVKGIQGPVLGFFGMIQDWVDLELLTTVARRNPGWSFVLVGKSAIDTTRLAALPNVHLPGQVPYATLPGYCRAFDVALIPFHINELTRNVNPIKLREYLAAGLPVVSTDLPEVRPYRPHVLIAHDVDSFEAACRTALQQRTASHRKARQDAVRNETWDRKVEILSELVEGRLAVQV